MQRKRITAVALAVAAAGGCDVSLVGRRCDAANMCGDGLVCVDGRCGFAVGRDGGAPEADGGTPLDAGSEPDGGLADAGPPVTLVVEPAFPTAGAPWNAYVTPDATLPLGARDLPCASRGVSVHACLHGGERRLVRVAGATTCAGLTLADALGAFDWRCTVAGDAPAFVSTLRDDRVLADLLDGVAFRANHVTMSGALGGQSAPAQWWDNPVRPLPDNSAAGSTAALLDETFAIYTATSDVVTHGWIIDADAVAFAPQRAVTIRPAPTFLPNTNGGGEPGTSTEALVAAGNHVQLWIEGVFDGALPDRVSFGLHLIDVDSSIVRRVTLRELGFQALTIDGNANRISHVTMVDGGGLGGGGEQNLFTDLHFAGANGEMYGTNRFVRVLFDGVSNALHIRDAAYITDFTGVSCGTALKLDGDGPTVLAGFALARCGRGVELAFVQAATLHVGGAYGNNDQGIHVRASANRVTLSQVAALENSVGIDAIENTGSLRIAGALLVGGNRVADCTAPAQAGMGVTSGPCAPSGSEGATDFPAPSSATLRPQRSSQFSWFGPVSAFRGGGDTVNSSDVDGGLAEFPSSPPLDRVGYEHRYRAWGRDGNLPFDGVTGGSWGSGAGRIWDWRLLAADAVLANRTGDGASPNDPFVPGAACPAAVHGDRVTTNLFTPPDTYLLAAIEDIEDGVGDDDALCESGETCLYAPHFSSWQGDGPLVGACVFADGAVVGVTLFARETPGASF